MAGNLQGSAYKAAIDISRGYLSLNITMLKRIMPSHIKSIYFELRKELNILRASIVDQKDEEAVREKNLKISRIVAAMRLMDLYMRQNKIK